MLVIPYGVGVCRRAAREKGISPGIIQTKKKQKKKTQGHRKRGQRCPRYPHCSVGMMHTKSMCPIPVGSTQGPAVGATMLGMAQLWEPHTVVAKGR